MLDPQILINGLVLGGLYACVAVGFSLVWGVLNIINMLHGSLIILGAYLAFFAHAYLGIHPFLALLPVAALLFVFGYVLQRGVINRVVSQPVLLTLVLTFGLDLILYNFMVLGFSATPRRVDLDMGRLELFGMVMPVDRLAAMALALLLTLLLYLVLRTSRIGRAIVAVRMDRDAAALMGIKVPQIYAITFGIGALMAGAAGTLLAVVYPFSPAMTGLFLGKAFVVCVIGGLGSVPGALAGGIALGLIESVAGVWFGPQNAITAGFVLMLLLLLVRPTGLLGRAGYE
jgi:branched-chain amino acid transport system permease protein